jgi:hypothetical protein
MNTYLLGQAVELSAEFRDRDDNLIDAAAVRLLLFGPTDSVPSVVALSIISTGKVRADFTPNAVGVWRYRFETTAGTAAAEEGSFTVLARTVPSV